MLSARPLLRGDILYVTSYVINVHRNFIRRGSMRRKIFVPCRSRDLSNTERNINLKSGIRIRLSLLIILALMIIPVLASAYTYEFQKALGVTIDVLSKEEFKSKFGDNPDIPITDEDVISLAKKVYVPKGEKQLTMETEVEKCGMSAVSLLFASLQNPDISDTTRSVVDSIIAASIPNLPKTYSEGHFVFSYTDNADPDNNVTLDNIKQTASYLNQYWDLYTTSFIEPLVHNPDKIIEVKVYYLGAGLWGRTWYQDDFIELNSMAVKDGCRRRTVSAHELFHRVQFGYGLDVGGDDWLYEGTAVSAMKFTNAAIRDYMTYMNIGLDFPDYNLITMKEDAALFWVYLQERTGWYAISDVWLTYFANGKNAKAAVNTVARNRLGLTFDQFVGQWAQANYVKDTSNPGIFDYGEDEKKVTSCGRTYGPLNHVHTEAWTPVKNTTRFIKGGTVSPYGANYYDFSLDPSLTEITIKLHGDATKKLRYYILGMKNNTVMLKTAITTPDYTYTKTLTAGQWDKIALIAFGGYTGGNYQVIVQGSQGYMLTVNGGGTQGEITSKPIGINCGAICSSQFKSNSSVTLTATPNAGEIFDSWSGDVPAACLNNKTPVCTITMNGDKIVTAKFGGISGTWKGKYIYGNETGDETITITDNNGIITGTVTDIWYGTTCPGPISGTRTNKNVILTSTYPSCGGSASYNLTWDGYNSLQGSVNSGTVSLTRM